MLVVLAVIAICCVVMYDQIRRRVKQRLGVDPVHEASRSARDR